MEAEKGIFLKEREGLPNCIVTAFLPFLYTPSHIGVEKKKASSPPHTSEKRVIYLAWPHLSAAEG